jgi:hypothetical protein
MVGTIRRATNKIDVKGSDHPRQGRLEKLGTPGDRRGKTMSRQKKAILCLTFDNMGNATHVIIREHAVPLDD